MLLLVSSIMSILSFVYCLDYDNIFYALCNKHLEFENADPGQERDPWIT